MIIHKTTVCKFVISNRFEITLISSQDNPIGIDPIINIQMYAPGGIKADLIAIHESELKKILDGISEARQS
jgi:hypothetical protein